jgi:hypothetical protein
LIPSVIGAGRGELAPGPNVAADDESVGPAAGLVANVG